MYFLSHLDSLYKFYNELKTAKRASQVRISTPINRLRGSGESGVQPQQSSQVRRPEIIRSEVRPVEPAFKRSVQREILQPATQVQYPIAPNYQQQPIVPQYAYQPPPHQQQQPYQPPVFVIQPPAPQYQAPAPKEAENASLAYLQKMLELKNE